MRKFEKLVWGSRYVVLIAIICSLLSSLVMMLLGAVDIVVVISKSYEAFQSVESYGHYNQSTISYLVGAVDDFLIGTVFLIFAAGLYELFLGKIEDAESEVSPSKVLVIKNLDQLKENIAKVVIMVLTVTFFKYAIEINYEEISQLLYLSIGILLIAVATYLTHKVKETSLKFKDE